MRQDDREPGPASAGLASTTHDDGVTATAEDERIAGALAAGLGRLRGARPGFQEQLERRLLDRLAEPPRPWWQRLGPARRQARRPVAGITRLPRRSLLGLAAATAVALAAASLSLPLVGTSEVSAREILEKVQANSENPVLAGVNSFHLTAKIWTNGGPKHIPGGPRELVTEQWFVAPDRMRTESRAQDASGKTVISGFMVNGNEPKPYATTGATEVFMMSFFAAPIGAKPGAGPRTAGVGAGPPPGTPRASAGVRVEQRETDDGSSRNVVFVVSKPDGDGKPGDQQEDVVFVGQNCPEPERTGEATIAGRPVFVVENDFSSCLPANAPDEMRGRHVRWVDQKTFLPLKMETYDTKGALVDRYEVTSIEYDVSIPDKTFTELPPGTTVQEAMPLPMLPGDKRVAPAAKPASP